MEKLYLLIIDLYEEEENSIVDICTTKEKAEELMNQYIKAGEDDSFSYHIDEINVDYSKDVLWDCYKNSKYFRREE